jgi:hypothetical protein
MTHAQIVELVAGWDGVLALTPGPGDGTPEIAWGDTFFYYAPDGVVPTAVQPFATIVTKDYPGDESSRLGREGVYRVNIHPSRGSFESLSVAGADPAELDRIVRHPVYGDLGWLAAVAPAERSLATVRELLREAYEADRARYLRRRSPGGG